MSESSAEVGVDEDELGPDPALIEEIGPAPSPVTVDQVNRSQDATATPEGGQDTEEAQQAAESIDVAGPDQEVSS